VNVLAHPNILRRKRRGIQPEVIKPTEEFFPYGGNTQAELAESIFRQVKQHSGMSDWPCRLQAQKADPSVIVAPTVVLQGAPSSPLGSFTCDSEKEEIIITYNPASVSNPMSLIATFAHELAHYLTGTFQEEPPGGWENWEYATDGKKRGGGPRKLKVTVAARWHRES